MGSFIHNFYNVLGSVLCANYHVATIFQRSFYEYIVQNEFCVFSIFIFAGEIF